MFTTLTPKQQETLDFLKSFIAKNGHAPTIAEMQEAMGLSSARSITQRLEALEEKGLIRRDRFQRRGIFIVSANPASPEGMTQVPVIASAGCDAAEVYAQEQFDEFLSIDKKLLTEGRDIVAIKAVGNSMIDAGINNGDYVLVDVTENVGDGDRVVALIGDMAVIKRFKRAGETIVLNPENKDGGYQPIVIRSEDAKIFGRVLSVIPSGSRPTDETQIVYEDWYKSRIHTSRDEMAAIVSRELELFLPRIPGNLQHNMVRMAYNSLRLHDLSKGQPEGPEAILRKAYEYVQGTGSN